MNKGGNLIKRGWMVIRFFESEIKKDISKCMDKLFYMIKNNSKENEPKNIISNQSIIGGVKENGHN